MYHVIYHTALRIVYLSPALTSAMSPLPKAYPRDISQAIQSYIYIYRYGD